MLKAFELQLKVGLVPVFALPHIQASIVNKVKECKKFQDYVERLNNPEKGLEVAKIELLSVEMFGERVGFVNLRAITAKDGFNLPGYVFLRGAAVAILMLVNGKILVVEQYRVPVQKTLLEAPAGMLDESGDFIGTAALEIAEETSIKLSNDKLVALGSMYPSPGGCDEEILMFYSEINLPEEEIKVIEQKIHGKEGEKEKIRVKFINNDLTSVLETKDAKLISLVLAYQARTQSSKL